VQLLSLLRHKLTDKLPLRYSRQTHFQQVKSGTSSLLNYWVLQSLDLRTLMHFTKRKTGLPQPLPFGLGVFVALLLAASASAYVGGSAIINPAVALSLGALKWELWPLAVYILAPVIGGVIGFILHDTLRVESDGGRD